MTQLPYPLLEVECRGSHEQVDRIAMNLYREVAVYSMVLFSWPITGSMTTLAVVLPFCQLRFRIVNMNIMSLMLRSFWDLHICAQRPESEDGFKSDARR